MFPPLQPLLILHRNNFKFLMIRSVASLFSVSYFYYWNIPHVIHTFTMHSSVNFRKLIKAGQLSALSNFRMLSSSKWKSVSISRHSLSLLLFRFWQDNLFSVSINWPIRTSHVNGIIWYVAFHVWLLLRSVHVVMNISNSVCLTNEQ